eukprot:TRINITY_DN660_c0_g1_i1.p1 TRINITY_DN660_c0_g1~~TRINITY_DN660_c0_g1_i1.p1  ORF type:complete len:616 (+),score=226.11 TRINITY_DN660_c0_g1_i1:318-2165(+)
MGEPKGKTDYSKPRPGVFGEEICVHGSRFSREETPVERSFRPSEGVARRGGKVVRKPTWRETDILGNPVGAERPGVEPETTTRRRELKKMTEDVEELDDIAPDIVADAMGYTDFSDRLFKGEMDAVDLVDQQKKLMEVFERQKARPKTKKPSLHEGSRGRSTREVRSRIGVGDLERRKIDGRTDEKQRVVKTRETGRGVPERVREIPVEDSSAPIDAMLEEIGIGPEEMAQQKAIFESIEQQKRKRLKEEKKRETERTRTSRFDVAESAPPLQIMEDESSAGLSDEVLGKFGLSDVELELQRRYFMDLETRKKVEEEGRLREERARELSSPTKDMSDDEDDFIIMDDDDDAARILHDVEEFHRARKSWSTEEAIRDEIHTQMDEDEEEVAPNRFSRFPERRFAEYPREMSSDIKDVEAPQKPDDGKVGRPRDNPLPLPFRRARMMDQYSVKDDGCSEMVETSPKTPSSIRAVQDIHYEQAIMEDRGKLLELKREREREFALFKETKGALERVERHKIMMSGLEGQQKGYVQVSLSTPIPDQPPMIIKFLPDDSIELLRDYAFEIMRTAGMGDVQLCDVIIERSMPRELLPAERDVTFASKGIRREKIMARVKKAS